MTTATVPSAAVAALVGNNCNNGNDGSGIDGSGDDCGCKGSVAGIWEVNPVQGGRG